MGEGTIEQRTDSPRLPLVSIGGAMAVGGSLTAALASRIHMTPSNAFVLLGVTVLCVPASAIGLALASVAWSAERSRTLSQRRKAIPFLGVDELSRDLNGGPSRKQRTYAQLFASYAQPFGHVGRQFVNALVATVFSAVLLGGLVGVVTELDPLTHLGSISAFELLTLVMWIPWLVVLALLLLLVWLRMWRVTSFDRAVRQRMLELKAMADPLSPPAGISGTLETVERE
jgi:hypothetical protein